MTDETATPPPPEPDRLPFALPTVPLIDGQVQHELSYHALLVALGAALTPQQSETWMRLALQVQAFMLEHPDKRPGLQRSVIARPGSNGAIQS